MAKITFDVSNVEDVGDRKQAPVGIYRAKVVKAEPKQSKAGNQMVETQLTLTHNAEGKKVDKEGYGDVWTYPIFDHEHPYVQSQLKEFLLAFGFKPKGSFDPDKIVGKSIQVKLKSDTDQDGDYRPRVGKIMALAEDEDEGEEEPDAEEGGEDGPEAHAEGGEETYDEDELNSLAKDALIEVGDALGVEQPSRFTKALKAKYVAAILEAQGGDEEEEDDEPEAEEEEGESIDLDTLDRKELKALIAEHSLDITVLKRHSDDDIRKLIADALGAEAEDDEEEEEEDDEPDGEEAEDNYDELSVTELKAELTERELPTSGKQAILIARLRKDDQESPF